MMFGEAVGRNRIGIVWVGDAVFWIVWPIPVFHDWIDRSFGVKCIRDRRLYRLIVRWQWTIGQSAGSIDPAFPFAMHGKWISARMGIQPIAIWIGFGVWGLGFRKVRNIIPDPAPLCSIAIIVKRVPPDVFLALRPRLARRVGRGAIIQNVAVGRPGKAPSKADVLITLTAACQVLPLFRHNATENPAATSCTAIGFERGKIFDHFAVGDSVTIDLLHDIFDHGFLKRSCAAVIPEQVLYRFVTLLRAVLVHLFQAQVEFCHKPVFRTRITW